jgi:hypothetical protein
MFNPFQNKIIFESFTLDSQPCPKCSCKQVLIAPTTNTHAASSRCAGCGKFFRWLGKGELHTHATQHPQSTSLSTTPGHILAGDNHASQL